MIDDKKKKKKSSGLAAPLSDRMGLNTPTELHAPSPSLFPNTADNTLVNREGSAEDVDQRFRKRRAQSQNQEPLHGQ